MIKFPRGFLWGAATSAYQVEGGNSNADWWEWEKQAGKVNSGSACRHYDLYEQDFDLAKGLNHNAHRLSVEWSRIEPEEGKFSQKELGHYLEVLRALRDRGIEPVVTLHHFTNPIWFAKSGGWLNPRAVHYFPRFCDFLARAMAGKVHYWITINEPNVYISHSYIYGAWPPQERSLLKAKKAEDNLVLAHIKAYKLIHKIYQELNLSRPAVSIAQNMMSFVPCANSLKNRFAAYLRNNWYNLGFLDRVARRRTLDFIGVNYYSRQLVDLKKWGIVNLAADVCESGHYPVKKNSLGWDIYPEGLYRILLSLKGYNLPILISENGICTEDDDLRWEYIYSHLKNIYLAMAKGVRVEAYLYWSLLDNFEWDKGFSPRFGLIDVDYSSYKRTVRGSARKLALVSSDGVLE